MTDSYILEKIFRTLTDLKFETLILSFNCLSTGKTLATFTLTGKTPLEILFITASPNDSESTVADNFTSL